MPLALPLCHRSADGLKACLGCWLLGCRHCHSLLLFPHRPTSFWSFAIDEEYWQCGQLLIQRKLSIFGFYLYPSIAGVACCCFRYSCQSLHVLWHVFICQHTAPMLHCSTARCSNPPHYASALHFNPVRNMSHFKRHNCCSPHTHTRRMINFTACNPSVQEFLGVTAYRFMRQFNHNDLTFFTLLKSLANKEWWARGEA